MRKINFLLLFILVNLCSYAQDTLRFNTTLYFEPNITNATVGDTLRITDTMYNTGPSTLTGPVTFRARVNSTRIDSTAFFPNPPSIIPFDTISSGGTRQVIFTIIDSTPPFEVGPNLIVIWPVYNNPVNSIVFPGYVGPNDSILIFATYDTLTGIAGTSLAKMYIFQTPGRLNVNFGDAENLIQQVSIYDISGKGMYTGSAEKSKNIPTSGWTIGVYLCEITTYSGEKRTIKFRLE